MSFLKRILDSIIFIVGYFFGHKQTKLEMENKILKLDRDARRKRDKTYADINKTYDEYLRAYNNTANATTVSESGSEPDGKK